MDQQKEEKASSRKRKNYLSSHRKCIMRCKTGHSLHSFPSNPLRRAEWFKILGISSKKKNIFLCGAHFPPNYLYGKRINPHVFPNPLGKPLTTVLEYPSTKYTNLQAHNHTSIPKSSFISDEQPNQSSIPESSNRVKENHSIRLASLQPEYHISIPESSFISDEQPNQSSISESNFTSDKEQNETSNPEIFEVRNPSNENNIIMGCYYQTKDFLMATYQTNKLTHRQQLDQLNQKCKEQSTILKHLKSENYILTKALRRHQILFSQLRKIKIKNVILRRNIKKVKVKTKKLEEDLKREIIARNK